MSPTTPPDDRLEASSLCELFQRTAAERDQATALRNCDGTIYATRIEYADRVEQLARGLAGLGVEHGDVVALMMGNRPEFHLLDTAALHYQGMAHGLDVTCVDDLKQLPQVLLRMRPHIWGPVPRLWEKLHAALKAGISMEQDEHRRAALEAAIGDA